MKTKKMNLLHQLVQLSNDQEIQPYIDDDTASKIKQILQQYQSLNFLEEYQDLQSDFHKIKTKPSFQQIDQRPNQNIYHLFSHDSTQALKEITAGLENNNKKINISNAISKMNTNPNFLYNDQQKIHLLSSTCPKFSTLKFHDSNKENTHGKKKSKEKNITYKIGKGTSKFSKNTQSSTNLIKNKSTLKTSQKKSVSRGNSKSNLKSQNPKANLKLMASSVKQQNPTLKNSQSKNSLLLTKKIRLNSVQDIGKRQLKSFSSLQTPIRNKSNSKNKNKKEMLKKIQKINTEFSAEERTTKLPFFFEELQNDEHENKNRTIDKKHRMITEIPHQNCESENQIVNSIEKFGSTNCLGEIIAEIYSQQYEKLDQKQKLQDEISKIKEMIASQNKRLQQTNNKNNKLIREIETVSQFQKSIVQGRSVTQKSISEMKRKVKVLKQKYAQKNEEYKEIVEGGIKDEQQLIQMYEKVIDELKKEIRQQNRLKNEVKICLQKSQKKMQSKEIKFNSTLMSTKKIKDDLTDAFKQWV